MYVRLDAFCNILLKIIEGLRFSNREYNLLKLLNSVKLGQNHTTLYAHKSRIIVTDFYA